MIRINLLPHREMRRERRKKQFVVQAAISAGLAASVLLGIGFLINSQIDAQLERNRFIDARNKDLDAQIKEIANLQTEIEALRARQSSVESLQSNRTIPVHLLDELVRNVPEGVYLTSLKQSGRTMAIKGRAQTTERIADLLRNLASKAPTMEKPQLGVIKAIIVRKGDRRSQNVEERRLFEFSMNALIKVHELAEPGKKKKSGKLAKR